MAAEALPALLSAGGSIAGGLLGSSGANQQIQAMKDAIAYQKQRDATNQANYAPYLKFGGEQLNSLNSWLADPTNNPASHLDPGYAFRLEQGNKGIESNAGTAGLLQSGDTLRGLTQYGQDMSSQEYNNAFNRYLAEGQFKQGLANTGLDAAGGIGGLLNQGAQTVGNLTANTNFGAPQQIWGDALAGIGGTAANAFARRYPGGTPAIATPGGSNVFASNASYGAGATTPWYMQA